jgi:hypothetical protein
MYFDRGQMFKFTQLKGLLGELSIVATTPERPVYLISIPFQFRTNS